MYFYSFYSIFLFFFIIIKSEKELLMVVYIRIGRKGRSISFPENINIKQTFGPFAILLDRYLKEVPIKPSGEAYELKENEYYIVEINGINFQHKRNKKIKKKKKEVTFILENLSLQDKHKNKRKCFKKKEETFLDKECCNCNFFFWKNFKK